MNKQNIFISFSIFILLCIVGFVIFAFTSNTDKNSTNQQQGERYLTFQINYNFPVTNQAQQEIQPIHLPNEEIKLSDLFDAEHIRLSCYDDLPWQTLNRMVYDSTTVKVTPITDCIVKKKHTEATIEDLEMLGVPNEIQQACLNYLHESKSINEIFYDIELLFNDYSSEQQKVFTIGIKRYFI